MVEYIEREAALAVFGDIHPLDHNANAYAQQIKHIPAADVRPVVRGEWVDAVQGCGDSPHVRCSNCNEYYWRNFSKFRFCPNCGADMRGKESEMDGKIDRQR